VTAGSIREGKYAPANMRLGFSGKKPIYSALHAPAQSEGQSCSMTPFCSSGSSRSFEVGVLLDEVAQRPVVREERHGLVQLVRPKLTPVATTRPRGCEGGVGLDPAQEGPRRRSRRDSALYSLFRRYWTTSNCRGPTAARSVAPGGAEPAMKDWTTPSCRSCSRPALNFFESDGLGLEM
jgi:hypothetical protein